MLYVLVIIVKDFNVRYRSLYSRLEKKKRRRITVLDYCDSLKTNYAAWKKVTLKGDINLKKAYEVAEKIDRLEKKSTIEDPRNQQTRN